MNAVGPVRQFFNTRVLLPLAKKLLDLRPADSGRGWFRVMEKYTGAWQQHVEIHRGVVDAYWANFSCKTLIANDISKMPPAVMTYNATTKIWEKTNLRGKVLAKPNHYQTMIEFIWSWVHCELSHGNTYVLKVRDPKTKFVIALYILDPCRVTPMITSDGGVYYKLETDALSLLPESDGSIYVPASEIIHDRMYPIYHPLVGVAPIFACGLQAMQGSAILNTSASFFENRGMPAGILTAPGTIPDETARRLKEYFDDNFTGQNAGKVAVLGDDLKFESISATAEATQLIEQLKMTGEMIAACYHVPGYKIGVGQMPTVNNTAALNQQYYDQCLQHLIEKMEARLDEGLELEEGSQCWFDTAALLRMDPSTRATTIGQKVKDGIWSPNEGRREDNMPPVTGGEAPFLQQQNYSLADLAARSEKDKEAAKKTTEVADIQGAQLANIQQLITAVINGELPLDTARALIAASVPSLSSAEIEDMLKPLIDFKPPPKPVAADNGEPSNADEEDEEDGADEVSETTEEELSMHVENMRRRIMEVSLCVR